MDQALVPVTGATTGAFGFRARLAHRLEASPTRIARAAALALGTVGGFAGSRLIRIGSRRRTADQWVDRFMSGGLSNVGGQHFVGLPRPILKAKRQAPFHPLAGFVGMARGRRRRRSGFRLSRKKRHGSRKANKVRQYARVSASHARRTRKKIATEFDLTAASQSVELDLTQKIIGGDGTNQQIWNTISQGVGSGQRIGERVRRTGLWLDVSFFRGLPQADEAANHYVRVIFARQRGHGHFPDTAAGTGGFPAWPLADACFSREWHREYKLVKDRRIYFGLRRGIITSAIVNKRVTFKLKFNYPCTFDGNGSDMDMGRLYMFVICPDPVPATASDLKITINNYCNYFVDELA